MGKPPSTLVADEGLVVQDLERYTVVVVGSSYELETVLGVAALVGSRVVSFARSGCVPFGKTCPNFFLFPSGVFRFIAGFISDRTKVKYLIPPLAGNLGCAHNATVLYKFLAPVGDSTVAKHLHGWHMVYPKAALENRLESPGYVFVEIPTNISQV